MGDLFLLKEYGKRFWTRPLGAEIREKLDAKLQALGEGEVITLDLEDVEVFDVSFAGEFFVKTAINLQSIFRGRFVVLTNMADHCRETLEVKLQKDNQIMIERVGDKIRLLGKFNPKYQETIDAIASANVPVSSTSLGIALDSNSKALNERLKKLTDLALVKRESGLSEAGREEFLYSMVE